MCKVQYNFTLIDRIATGICFWMINQMVKNEFSMTKCRHSGKVFFRNVLLFLEKKHVIILPNEFIKAQYDPVSFGMAQDICSFRR